jgi:hypothetical protein
MLAAFFITNPFASLDFKFFLNAVSAQKAASQYMGLTHHLKYSLVESISYIILILGAAGFLFLFQKDKKQFLIFGSFPIVFYLHLVFLSQPFARYVIPLVPFLAISSAWFVFDYLFKKLNYGYVRIIFIFMSFILLIPLLFKTLYMDKLFTSSDTRIESGAWIKKHLKANTRLALDHTFFRPTINQSLAQVREKYELIGKQQGLSVLKAKKLNLMLRAQDTDGYYIYFLSIDPKGQGQFFSTMPALNFDLNELKKNAIEYVVINYASRQDNENFYSQLKNNATLIKSFSPYRNGAIRFSYDTIATTCMPFLSNEIYSRIKNGPALEIYKLNK